MKGTRGILCILCMIFLAGCTFGQATEIPTNTPPQARFIRVATPTGGATSTLRPTETATQVPTVVISGTVVTLTETPTLSPTATLTPTPTITPTPTPQTVTTLPNPGGYAWQEVVGGLNQPVSLASPKDESGRLFIVEQAGVIRILKDGSLLAAPFLDITPKVDCCGERGLLGLAFHPRFAENGFFYIDYVESENNQLFTVIARYRVSESDANLADAGSEQRLLRIEQPYQNHKGGQLQFGPDGYLYIGMGDGGSEGDPLGNGQSLQTMLGKILRIDVDHGFLYAIPPDNPFTNGGGLPEIWAYGLRNPWRFSFDRLTGDVYIGDVGQDAWEEIDFLPVGSPGGANFGWSYFEGNHPYRGSPPGGATFVTPVAEYSHTLPNPAVIGGYVYRGQNLPEWQGVYLYADYGSGRVWGLLHLPDGSWQTQLMFETGMNISSFGEDGTGEIYMLDYSGRLLSLK